MSMIRMCSVALGACAALVCLFAPTEGFAQDPEWHKKICERSEDNRNQGGDACDATPFLSANVGSTQAESFHYTTPHMMTNRKFNYDYLGGSKTNPLSLYNSTNVRWGLFHECDGAVVTFPEETSRDYVTFVTSNFNTPEFGVNFLAVNASGQVIDEVTRDFSPQDEFEVVTLGPDPQSGSSNDIRKVYMWHVDTATCQLDCVEPPITEVRACDVRLPTN